MHRQADRVADSDRVAQVPPAAAQRQRRCDRAERPSSTPARRDHADPRQQSERGKHERELRPRRHAQGEAGHGQGAGVLPRVHRQRDTRQQARETRDVVERLARLGPAEHRQRDHQAPGRERQRLHPPAQAHAPGRQQRDRQPQQVQQRRQEVAVQGHDADRVQQLRVGRVVGDERVRLREQDARDRPRLREVRRERHVVPERVEVEHPRPQRVRRLQSPLGGHDHHAEDRRCHRHAPARRRRPRRADLGPRWFHRRPLRGGGGRASDLPPAERGRGPQQRDQLRRAVERDQAEQLAGEQQDTERDHRLAEHSQRPRRRQPAPAQPMRDQPRRQHDRGQPQDPQDELADRHRAVRKSSSRSGVPMTSIGQGGRLVDCSARRHLGSAALEAPSQ